MNDGKDHTGLGPFRIPLLLGATVFAFYIGISNIVKVVQNRPVLFIAKNNDTLLSSHAFGIGPNLVTTAMLGILFTFAGCMFLVGDYFMLRFYLGGNEKK